jgi:hypothetical protein
MQRIRGKGMTVSRPELHAHRASQRYFKRMFRKWMRGVNRSHEGYWSVGITSSK